MRLPVSESAATDDAGETVAAWREAGLIIIERERGSVEFVGDVAARASINILATLAIANRPRVKRMSAA